MSFISLHSLPCAFLTSAASLIFFFLEVTLRDLLYITVYFVLLIINDANRVASLPFPSWSTGRFQHQRLFIHHIRTGPMHMFKLFCSWICTSHHLHKVTSGRITITVSWHYVEMQGTKKLVHSSTHNTIIISTFHYLQQQKMLADFHTCIQYKIKDFFYQITVMPKSHFRCTITRFGTYLHFYTSSTFLSYLPQGIECVWNWFWVDWR